MQIVNMIGQKIGNLLVISKAQSRSGEACWICQCDCGERTTVRGSNLRKSKTRSCGCLVQSIKSDGVTRILSKYKAGARRRRIPFELSTEEFIRLIAMPCDYCGLQPSQTIKVGHRQHKNHPKFLYNGIDRVDTSLEYVMSNVVPCCGDCNRAKGRMSRIDFFRWVEAIHGHLHNKHPWVESTKQQETLPDVTLSHSMTAHG